MGLFSFIKEAGEKLFGHKEVEQAAATGAPNLAELNQKAGDASKYPVIFEANKPMLTHPDKIYPGQKLRIPAL